MYICSTLLCTIYCLNFFAKMLSGPQSYMKSNSASNWCSFQCILQCRIQTGREFCWVTQHFQKEICSTLLCTIYCLNYFAKMLSGPQSYMESNSAFNWYSFQYNLMQNSDWRRILLSDSTPPNADLFHSTSASNLIFKHTLLRCWVPLTPPKADLFHSTMHNLLSKLLCLDVERPTVLYQE